MAIKMDIGNNINAKKRTALCILFSLVSGCSVFPPKPAECQGPYVPVNASQAESKSSAADLPSISNVNDSYEVRSQGEGVVNGK